MQPKARVLQKICLAFACLCGLAIHPAIATEKVLHSFHGGSDGAFPFDALISDAAGNLYGTTNDGGNGTGCNHGPNGCGTIFRLAPDGTETILYSFQGGSDGAFPSASLIVDSAGNLYGTTAAGGSGNACGTVFKLTPGEAETPLYTFQCGSDGNLPLSNLLRDGNGNLYGTTTWGGSFNGTDCAQGCGTVFEVKPDGTKLTLYTFLGGSDGAVPAAGLAMGNDGNFYGTTSEGGIVCNNAATNGCGTVFKLTPGGTETVFYAFQGGNDGRAPFAGLILDAAGNFYGTTAGGGTCSPSQYGCGTVFKISPTGAETVLYAFQGGSDGVDPVGGVILDKAGNLYGTTFSGGGTGCKRMSIGCGTVFKLAPTGQETVLLAFITAEGRFPAAGLLLGRHGELYGTTTSGGRHDDGVVFKLRK